MKSHLVSICCLLLLMTGCNETKDPQVYLKDVLCKLEKIESASYHEIKEAWTPGDTVAAFVVDRLVKEYTNPADTTIGASYVEVDYEDPSRLEFAYDGTIRVITYHEHNGLIVDDFSTNTLPFRLVSPPFFNYAKSIIRYMLETQDSIRIETQDMGDHYYFKLTIEEDQQVEFFGKPHYIDNPYFDPLSIYELRISKSNKLPYYIRREMGHNISATTCLNPVFNTLSADDLDITDYFPEGYEIREYGDRRNTKAAEPSKLIGQPAPKWTLNNIHEQPVALDDIQSKVLLINFTGIGCGPCLAAIPFLKELKETYAEEDFELISIETWNRKPGPLQRYAEKHELNYRLLCATNEVVSNYQSTMVPTFFILDQQRTIRQVFTGYSLEHTDRMITNTVKELLQK